MRPLLSCLGCLIVVVRGFVPWPVTARFGRTDVGRETMRVTVLRLSREEALEKENVKLWEELRSLRTQLQISQYAFLKLQEEVADAKEQPPDSPSLRAGSALPERTATASSEPLSLNQTQKQSLQPRRQQQQDLPSLADHQRAALVRQRAAAAYNREAASRAPPTALSSSQMRPDLQNSRATAELPTSSRAFVPSPTELKRDASKSPVPSEGDAGAGGLVRSNASTPVLLRRQDEGPRETGRKVEEVAETPSSTPDRSLTSSTTEEVTQPPAPQSLQLSEDDQTETETEKERQTGRERKETAAESLRPQEEAKGGVTEEDGGRKESVAVSGVASEFSRDEEADRDADTYRKSEISPTADSSESIGLQEKESVSPEGQKEEEGKQKAEAGPSPVISLPVPQDEGSSANFSIAVSPHRPPIAGSKEEVSSKDGSKSRENIETEKEKEGEEESVVIFDDIHIEEDTWDRYPDPWSVKTEASREKLRAGSAPKQPLLRSHLDQWRGGVKGEGEEEGEDDDSQPFATEDDLPFSSSISNPNQSNTGEGRKLSLHAEDVKNVLRSSPKSPWAKRGEKEKEKEKAEGAKSSSSSLFGSLKRPSLGSAMEARRKATARTPAKSSGGMLSEALAKRARQQQQQHQKALKSFNNSPPSPSISPAYAPGKTSPLSAASPASSSFSLPQRPSPSLKPTQQGLGGYASPFGLSKKPTPSPGSSSSMDNLKSDILMKQAAYGRHTSPQQSAGGVDGGFTKFKGLSPLATTSLANRYGNGMETGGIAGGSKPLIPPALQSSGSSRSAPALEEIRADEETQEAAAKALARMEEALVSPGSQKKGRRSALPEETEVVDLVTQVAQTTSGSGSSSKDGKSRRDQARKKNAKNKRRR